MNTRRLQKISTLEAPTLSLENNESAQLADELSTREAFAGYELAVSAGSGYVLPAMATQVVEVNFIQRSRAGAASAPLASASSGSGLTYTWVKGVVVKNNQIVGGFYDANKHIPWAGGSDCNMCWAGTAASMIAWWQNYYAADYCLSSSVNTSAERVFDDFRDNWANTGMLIKHGMQWWLVGGSEDESYSDHYDNYKKHGQGTSEGGFYSRFYSIEDADKVAYYVNARGRDAVSLANEMVNIINDGGIIGMCIIDPKDGGAHALTLWGIERDKKTKTITKIHYTDSNDGPAPENKQIMATCSVTYNSSRKAYEFVNSKDYNKWYLDYFDVLAPFEYVNVIKPSSLKTTSSEGKITFRWSGEQRKGLTYKLAYRLENEEKYTYVNCSSRSKTLALAKEGSYRWAVRALRSNGSALTDWSWGASFVYDATAPTLTLHGPYLKKKSGGGTRAEFSWSANEAVTYKLAINGTVIYSGKGVSRVVNLTGRSNRYTLKATDAYGNSSVKRGNLNCVGGKVSAPRGASRQVLNKGRQVSFSWRPVSSRKPVTYEIRLKGAGNKNYIYRRGYTGTSAVVKFSSQKVWKWAVRAVDSNGYYSSWRAGKAFNNDRLAPVIRFGKVVQQKKSAKRALVTIRWASNEKATFSLVVDGKRVYYGKGKKRSITLKTGYHNYTLTAKDAAGNLTRKSGKVYCDLVAPARPTGLTAELNTEGRGVAMNWNQVQDVSGVSYQFALRRVGATSWYYYDTKDTVIGFYLNESVSWEWAVRAVDGRGNRSSWVKGKTFTTCASSSAAYASRAASPAKAAVSLDSELALSSGSTALSSAAGSAACGYEAASALLSSNGQQQDKYGTLLAAC